MDFVVDCKVATDKQELQAGLIENIYLLKFIYSEKTTNFWEMKSVGVQSSSWAFPHEALVCTEKSNYNFIVSSGLP